MAPFTLAAVLLLAGACLAENEVTTRGTLASIEQFPSLVQIEMGVSTLWVQICSGSILTSRHVLSAAHCFYGSLASPRSRRIRAGSGRRGRLGIIVSVEKFTNHPSFGLEGLDGDITVVQLAHGLVFDQTIRPVSIINQGVVIPENVLVSHAGWGATAQNAIWPDREIYSVDMMTTNHAACVERYANLKITLPDINLPEIDFPEINFPDINLPDINLPDIEWPEITLPEINLPSIPEINFPEQIDISVRVSGNMFCSAERNTNGISHDPRDAGGPIYYGETVIGIVSFGVPILESVPMVSTTVSHYTDWIVATAVL